MNRREFGVFSDFELDVFPDGLNGIQSRMLLDYFSRRKSGGGGNGDTLVKLFFGRDAQKGHGIEEIRFRKSGPNLRETIVDWDRLAPAYVDDFRERDDSRLEVVEIPAFNRVRGSLAGKFVGDFGSGPLIYHARHVFAGDSENWPSGLLAIEPSIQMIKIARKLVIKEQPWAHRVHFLKFGMEEFELFPTEDRLDVAMAMYSVENSPDPFEAIQKIYNCLKPGGKFVGLFKDEKRNARYLKERGLNMKALAQSVDGMRGFWAREWWGGSGKSAVWAYYASSNGVWRKAFTEAGFTNIKLSIPRITDSMRQRYPTQTSEWDQIGNSGLIISAQKPIIKEK